MIAEYMGWNHPMSQYFRQQLIRRIQINMFLPFLFEKVF